MQILTFILFSFLAFPVWADSLQSVPFNQERCLRTYGRIHGNQVCAVLEEQYKSPYFRRDLVYMFSFSFCDRITGTMAVKVHHPSSQYCVVYYTDNEAKRSVIIKTLFGQNPRYPLLYKSLMVNIQVANPNSLFQISD